MSLAPIDFTWQSFLLNVPLQLREVLFSGDRILFISCQGHFCEIYVRIALTIAFLLKWKVDMDRCLTFTQAFEDKNAGSESIVKIASEKLGNQLIRYELRIFLKKARVELVDMLEYW